MQRGLEKVQVKVVRDEPGAGLDLCGVLVLALNEAARRVSPSGLVRDACGLNQHYYGACELPLLLLPTVNQTVRPVPSFSYNCCPDSAPVPLT